MEDQRLIEDLRERFAGKILGTPTSLGDLCVIIDKESVLEVMTFLKKEPFDFAMLLDLTCVDEMGRSPRFVMVYHLLSLSNNRRLRIKAGVDEGSPVVDSLTPLWKNANWLEREVFDMFGITFARHPDMRRLFMYDEFEGYPLKKDYPLRKRQPKIHLRDPHAD